MKLLTARLLIGFGLLCLILNLVVYWERTNPKRLSFSDYMHREVSSKAPIHKQPVRIIIKSLKIDLPIIPARISNAQWETTHAGVSYLVSSPIPGERGNSILYGHNWTNLLANLTKAKPGDTVEIRYSDSSKKIFVIELTGVISPNQTHILEPSTDTRITLYTCTGFFDSKRFVATAILH